MAERFELPLNMGEAILDAARRRHEKDYGNSAVAIRGGGILVPKRDGSLQIRRAGRGGPRITNTIAEGLHACRGKRGSEFLACIKGIKGFVAPDKMERTGGEKYLREREEIARRGFALP